MATTNMSKKTRKIVHIDEDKCDGCGLCVPSCAEGAIQIIDGKAKLLADNLCDGLGNCLGHCPKDAIRIEERPAEEFDEAAVERHLGGLHDAHAEHDRVLPVARPLAAHPGIVASLSGGCSGGGCPGSMMRMLNKDANPAQPRPSTTQAQAPAAAAVTQPRQSQLGHWPVQLALLPVNGPMWKEADVLIAADCVSFAMPDFHEALLAGRSLAIACPKLDDVEPYVQKLTAIFANNTVRSVTVAHMEVPCCTGIVYAVRKALEASGRDDILLRDVTVGIDGNVK